MMLFNALVRLLTMTVVLHVLVVVGVSGRGDEEEEVRVYKTAEWLDEFYSNIDNVLITPVITPKVSDVPDYVYVPSNNTEEDGGSDARPITTKPPERGRKLGRLRQDDLLEGQAIGLNILYNAIGLVTSSSPPDTVGDVGTKHYVQMVNSGGATAVRVMDKNTSSVLKIFILDSLGTGSCADGKGDPIVLFDQLASRWFLTEFSGTDNALCAYVSTTDSAMGAFYNYAFPTPNFPDYPKYGVWHDAYYIGTNEDTPAMYALERSKMLIGDAAMMVRNTGPTALSGFPFQMIPPVDADGDRPPPTGPGLFVRHVDDESHDNYLDDGDRDLFEIWTLAVAFPSTTTTLTKLQTIEVTEFDSNLCGLEDFFCVPQPGTTNRLDPLREVVMNRPQYRNFGTHETILVTWVTDVGGTDQHGIRWMELRKQAGAAANSWVIHQENTFSPDATNRWMQSAAMNKCGDIAIGYSVSSSTIFPGIRVTGRLGTDPLNTLDAAETIIIAGAASQTSTVRWGDYSAMAVDPVDDATFWYTTQYIPSASISKTTRIVKFTLGTSASGDCPPASPSSSPTPAPDDEPPNKSTCGIIRMLLGIC